LIYMDIIAQHVFFVSNNFIAVDDSHNILMRYLVCAQNDCLPIKLHGWIRPGTYVSQGWCLITFRKRIDWECGFLG